MPGSLPSSARTGYDELLKIDRQNAEDSVPLLMEACEQGGSGNSVVLEDRVIDVAPGPIAHPGQLLNQFAQDQDNVHQSENNTSGEERSSGGNSQSKGIEQIGRPSTPPSPNTLNAPFKPSPLRHHSEASIQNTQPQDRLKRPHRIHNHLYSQSSRAKGATLGLPGTPEGEGRGEGERINDSRGSSPGSAELSPFSSPTINPVDRTRSGSILSITTINDTFDKLSRGVRRSYQNFRTRSRKSRFGAAASTNVYSYEIYYSVFKLPNWSRLVIPHLTPYIVPVNGLLDSGSVRRDQFQGIVKEAIHAFSHGISPRRIAQGSSGSYFIYDNNSKVVGVFKPQDEEPYGKLSPKWTKWIHRNLFPCFFGRSCLIPNNGYICEAAASVLDRQLQTNMVPFTDTVFLSSPSFYYPYFDRRRFDNASRPLPEKVGSFQLFLHGYEQANVFLRKHPLPSHLEPGRRNALNSASIYVSKDGSTPPESAFRWSVEVLQQFREELEKLVILDYIMRNTDRGLDNWMIKLEWELIEASAQYRFLPKLKIGAIDSGLSFPWKHPDEWRSYPFGWLFLPLALIGQPFSKKTREHFLPILCSTKWWEDSTIVLREMFNRDPDFKERMWRRQLAVLKGQAFNVVECLKSFDQGPLELARHTRCMVWDDELEVPVSVSVSTVQNAMDTPMWEPYHDDEGGSTPNDGVVAFPTIDEESTIENTGINESHPFSTLNTSTLNLTPAMASSPVRRQSISARKGRKRGGSLALEAKFKELQKGGGDKGIGVNIWQQLVNSDDLGEPPLDPNSKDRQPKIVINDSDCANEDTAPLLGPAFEPVIHRVTEEAPIEHLSTHAGWADDELGYAYITGHHATRKVVVERLQTINSKPPVFTWC